MLNNKQTQKSVVYSTVTPSATIEQPSTAAPSAGIEQPSTTPYCDDTKIYMDNTTTTPSSTKPKHPYKTFLSYYLFSIFNVLCCNVCLAVPSLVYVVKARVAARQGRTRVAEINATRSLEWGTLSFIFGFLSLSLFIIYLLYTWQKYYNYF